MAYQEYDAEGECGSRQVTQEVLQSRITNCRKVYKGLIAQAAHAKAEAERYETTAARFKEEFDYYVAIETARFGG